MMESGVVIEGSALHGSALPADGSSSNGLEQRVHRLEDAVATLQDTRALEERVVQRVSDRVQHRASVAVLERDPTGILLDASRHLLPAALPSAPSADTTVRSAWLPYEVYAEIRSMIAMFFDRRFRVSWTGRVVPLILLGVAIFSWVILDARLLYLGSILDKAVDVILIILAYKVLSREAARYRAVLPDLPPRMPT
jgi:hypothetical protein